MPVLNSPHDVEDNLAAPLGDLIAAVGRGIAEAQLALDEAALETIRKVYSPDNRSLLAELGYQPTWYKIPEVDAEIVISLSIHGHESLTASGSSANPASSVAGSGIKLYANPVDAHYTNKYDYNVQAASKVRFKIVPVPPTSQASSLILVPPGVIGMKYPEAEEFLNRLGIPFELGRTFGDEPLENKTVKETDPLPGEILPPGQKLKLCLSYPCPR